jgi:hypothetical protein
MNFQQYPSLSTTGSGVVDVGFIVEAMATP